MTELTVKMKKLLKMFGLTAWAKKPRSDDGFSRAVYYRQGGKIHGCVIDWLYIGIY